LATLSQLAAISRVSAGTAIAKRERNHVRDDPRTAFVDSWATHCAPVRVPCLSALSRPNPPVQFSPGDIPGHAQRIGEPRQWHPLGHELTECRAIPLEFPPLAPGYALAGNGRIRQCRPNKRHAQRACLRCSQACRGNPRQCFKRSQLSNGSKSTTTLGASTFS